MKYDVLIVGGGISGCMLAWQWICHGKKVCIIADRNAGSSHVAAGVYNPVVLKRFTPVWRASEQVEALKSLSSFIENELGQKLFFDLPIYRRFYDDKEILTWVKKSKRSDLSPFLSAVTPDVDIDGVDTTHGCGVVSHTGYLDCKRFILATLDYLAKCQGLRLAEFDCTRFNISDREVVYDGLSAGRVIFCEGLKQTANPYFMFAPLVANKGETLIVRIFGLKLPFILKGSVFVLPLKDDLFWVGATYDREFTDSNPTDAGRKFILDRLKKMIHLPFTLVDHMAGLRPTTPDRRPLVGTHPDHTRVHNFNGMGSRAVLITPWASEKLFQNIYHGVELPIEMDVSRYLDVLGQV